MGWNLNGKYFDPIHKVNLLENFDKLKEFELLFLCGSKDLVWCPEEGILKMFQQVGSEKKTLYLVGKDGYKMEANKEKERVSFSKDYAHADIIVSKEASKEVWPLMRDFLCKIERV